MPLPVRQAAYLARRPHRRHCAVGRRRQRDGGTVARAGVVPRAAILGAAFGGCRSPLTVDVSPPVPPLCGRAVSHFSLHCPPPVYSSAAMASPDGWRYAVHAMERRKAVLFLETEVVSAGLPTLTTMTTTTTATTKSNKNTPIPTAVVAGDDVSATRLALVTVLIKLLQRRAGAVDASAAANVEVLRRTNHHQIRGTCILRQ